LDYIDIASELARFVFKSPPEAVVHSISYRLSLSLDSIIPPIDPVDPLPIPIGEFARLSNKLGKQRTFHLFSNSCIAKISISIEQVSRSKLRKIGKIYFSKSRLKIHLNLDAKRGNFLKYFVEKVRSYSIYFEENRN